jgi:hypothetical protein
MLKKKIMKTIEESKLNMYLGLKDLTGTYEDVVKTLPKYMENYTILLDSIRQIQELSEQMAVNKTGYAAVKNVLREELTQLAADNSRKITAYARFTGNLGLLNETNYTTSDLGRLSFIKFRDSIKMLYDKIAANAAALAEYGITAGGQKIFMDKIEEFNRILVTPRSGITERASQRIRLMELFQAADTAVGNMDYAVGIIKLSNPAFYNVYMTGRKIINISNGRLALHGKAVDGATGEPVRGVIFEFDGGNAKNGIIRKKSARKGGFNVRNMAPGNWKVRVSKPGYKVRETEVSIASGERTELRVVVEKG